MQLIRLFVCLFTLFAWSSSLVSPTAEARQTSAASPSLWEITGDKGTVLLFGSIHMLKPGTVWYGDKLKAAFAKADHLVLEVVLNPEATAEIQKITLDRGLYQGGASLQTTVDAELYQHTVDAAKGVGVAEAVVNRLKPWYASVVVAAGFVQKLGYDPQSGVERVLTAEAVLRKLPISGLETAGEQLDGLAGMTPEAQVAMLRDTLRQFDDAEGLLDQMTTAWVKGQNSKLETLMVDAIKESPDLYEAMLVRRNKNWVPKIKELLQTPGNHLVVVGAAHLLGDDSVIALLEKDGLKVKKR